MANNIQTNTPSSFSLAATTENYLTSSQVITSYTKAMKEVDPNVVYRFGDESLGIDELFTNLGQTKGVESITFEHYEKDHIRELLNVVATTGGAAVETIAVATPSNIYAYGSPNFYQGNPAADNKFGANVRVNDLLEIGGVRCKVVSVSDPMVLATTFVARSVDGANIPAGESEIIIVGNAWAEMTDQPNGRETRLIKYSNDIQIIKDSYKVSGSAMGQKAWVNVQGQNKWYFEGIADTRKYFSSMCDLSYLVGEKITATNTAFDSTNQMEGLIPAINSYGVVEAYSLGGLTLTDFANVADAFAKNRGSQENMVLSGVGFKREISDLLRKSEGLKAGGVQYAGLGGEGRAVNLGFESFTYSDYTFHTKTLQAFNDPKTLGATSSIYKNYAIVIPTGTTTAFNYGQEKVVVPSMSLVHQEVEGEDMGYYEWITGAAGGARNSENDSMKVNMRARKSIELYGLGRFALFTA